MNTSNKIVCGMTHVDLGWKKGGREMEEVFDNFIVKLLDVCAQYPEFTHMIEQAYHYYRLKARRPDLFAKLVPLVKRGQLKFVTGLASTIENNVTNGESFVRNMQIGRRFIRDHFGVEVKTCAMVDTFGFPPQMPQLLRQMGYECLLANRLGCQQTDDVMRAVGLDGTELIVVGRDLHAQTVRSTHIAFKFFLNYADLEVLFEQASRQTGDPLLVVPYSENEVVPCDMIPERVRNSNGAFRFGHLDEFFELLLASGDAFKRISADINPEFSGTFSLRPALRVTNRRVETALLEADKWSAVLGVPAAASLDPLWWDMAYTQFHDIITGSHPTSVYLECMRRFGDVERSALDFLRGALATRAETAPVGTFTILNGLPFARTETLKVSVPDGWRGVLHATYDGKPADVRGGDGGEAWVDVTLDPLSAGVLELTEGVRTPGSTERVDVLENEFIRLTFDDRSMIGQLLLKESNTVVMRDVYDLLVVQREEGNFQIEGPLGSESMSGANEYTRAVFKRDGVGYAVFNGQIPGINGPDTTYELTLSLKDGAHTLGLRVLISWGSEGARLRLKLNTAMESSVNDYEVPFGVARRKPYPTRQTACGEWPAHRFVCMEDAQAGFGIALINEGVVGVEAADGVLWTTLLRAPVKEYAGMKPDDTSSEHGTHAFSFEVMPYHSNWRDAGIVHAAQCFNAPPMLIPGLKFSQASALSLQGDGVVLSAVHLNQSGDTVIRLYETHGRHSEAQLTVAGAQMAWASNVEEVLGAQLPIVQETISLKFTPYEIKTVIVRR